LSLSDGKPTIDLLIKARPPKLHLLLAMTGGDDLKDERTITPNRTKCHVEELQGNTSNEVMTWRVPTLPIPNERLCLHLENVNLRGNHNVFKNDMLPEGDIVIGFHPVPQK
jgi:hypothetical protein